MNIGAYWRDKFYGLSLDELIIAHAYLVESLAYSVKGIQVSEENENLKYPEKAEFWRGVFKPLTTKELVIADSYMSESLALCYVKMKT